MSSFFASAKTGIARVTQQAKVAVGRAESSVDGPYDEQVNQFKGAHATAKRLHKDSQKLLDHLREFGLTQASMAEGFLNSMEVSPSKENASVSLSRDAFKSIESARVQLDEQLRREVLEPITRNLARFDEIEIRVKSGGTHRVDMDRYGDDVRSIRSKNPNDPKLFTAEQKLAAATAGYQAMRDSLIADITQLLDDRRLIGPCATSYLAALAEYYRLSAAATAPFAGTSAFKAAPPPVRQVQAGGSGLSPRGPLPVVPTMMSNMSAHLPPPPLPRKTSVQAQGLFNFAANGPAELSFLAGDTLNILSQEGDWWQAEFNGRQGTVPRNYVQLI